MARLLKQFEEAHKHYERYLGWRYPNGWHSFDKAPWAHPWLTTRNLEALREFSRKIREEAASVASKVEARRMRFAFVGNMANSSYQRISALKQIGFDASLFIHPSDNNPMSQPEWEEFDGVVPGSINTLDDLRNAGINLPEVPNVHRIAAVGDWRISGFPPSFVRIADYMRWPEYFNYMPILRALQRMSAVYTVQVPYLAYLAHRPYVATHMGGDIWFECSRGDRLGALQRSAFKHATAITISNPWSPAFARRYGMRNMVTLPMILNTDTYCPGPPVWKGDWQRKIGGRFFVLGTARIDDRYKGSNIALEGFARFATEMPDARLVLLGWGNDLAKYKARFQELGIADRVLLVPPSGKQRLIQYLRSADCLLDQFVLGYFGLTALEALSVGLPVIMRLEDKQYGAFLDTGPPPILNMDSADSVASILIRLSKDRDFQQGVIQESLDWFVRNASPQAWGKAYRDLLVAAAVGHKFDFRKSPLHAPLSQEERDYHRHELMHAPCFPNYH